MIHDKKQSEPVEAPELIDNADLNIDEKVTWSSKQLARKNDGRRECVDRRSVKGRTITVPDMRSGYDRRTGEDRRKVRLTITGRAIDV